jgi:hypothetical protein
MTAEAALGEKFQHQLLFRGVERLLGKLGKWKKGGKGVDWKHEEKTNKY